MQCGTKVAVGLALIMFASALDNSAAAPVPDEDVQKITAAVPDKPTATPAKPRKLLVFSLCKGFRHGAIPYDG